MALNPNDIEALQEGEESEKEKEGIHRMNTFKEKYEMLEKIGQGSNGVVRKCRHKKRDIVYAVKCMQMDEEQILFLKKNFLFIKSLNHPNIIRYRRMFLDLPKRSCYLVMDFETMPSLENVGDLTEDETKNIIRQLF